MQLYHFKYRLDLVLPRAGSRVYDSYVCHSELFAYVTVGTWFWVACVFECV